MDYRQLVATEIIPAPIKEVWDAWTTKEGLASWLCDDANVELRLGGPFEILFSNTAEPGLQGSEGCRVLSFLPNKMLSFTWNSPPTIPEMRYRHAFVVVNFESVEGGTRLEIVHSGIGEGEGWDKVYQYFEKAWPWVAARCKERFENGPIPRETERADDQPLPDQFKEYIYFVRPTREPFVATDEERAVIGRHFAYLLAGSQDGVVGLVGRTQREPLQGICVFWALNDEAAKSFLANDPAVLAGIFKGEFHPFRTAIPSQI